MLTRRSFLKALGMAAAAAYVALPLLRESEPVPGWEDLPEEGPEPKHVAFSEPSWTRLVGDQDEAGTSLVVEDSTCFRADDVLLVPRTNELLRVVQVSGDGNVLTVVRGTCGSGPEKMLDRDWALRLRVRGEPA